MFFFCCAKRLIINPVNVCFWFRFLTYLHNNVKPGPPCSSKTKLKQKRITKARLHSFRYTRKHTHRLNQRNIKVFSESCINLLGNEEEMWDKILQLPVHVKTLQKSLESFCFLWCGSFIYDFRLTDALLRIYKQEILIRTMVHGQIFLLFPQMVD